MSAEPRCCQCGTARNPDGTSVTWKCASCEGLVCQQCTLTIPGRVPREYYEQTLCSAPCWEAVGKPQD